MKSKHLRVVPVVLAFLIIMPFAVHIVEGQWSGPGMVMEFFEIVDDPTFESPPEFAINGSSDDFTTSFHNSTGGDDYNRAILNWTHTANTSLDFRPPPDNNYPECNDFVYLYQNLTWDYEVEPEDIYVKIELRVNFTGDFEPIVSSEGEEMAKIHIWFIDPSGFWCVIDSFKVFHSNLFEEWIPVSAFEVSKIFQGMVENSAGVQEDPSDEFSICVGLAPSDSFRNYTSIEPWRTYNGSVTLEMSHLEVHVAADIVENIFEKLPVVTNQTWVSRHNEYKQYYEVASDNSVYGVTTSSSYEEGISQLSLVKWDPLANIVWNVTWNETRYAMGQGISIVDDYIYTTGQERSENGVENLIIIKWDTSGKLVWKRVIDTGMDERGWDIEVGLDGDFFVLGHRDFYSEVLSEYYYDAFFLNFDEAGNQNWNFTITEWPSDSSKIYVHPNGTPYTLGFPSDGFYKWTPDGSPVLVTDEQGINDVAFSPDGEVFFSRSDWPYIYINKINKSGQLEDLYKYYYLDSLPEPWTQTIDTDEIVVTNDSIYLIVEHERLNFYYELFKFDLDGNKIWNKTILDLNWRGLYSHFSGFHMEIGHNGLLYIGGPILTAEGGADMGVAIFNPEEVPIPTLTTTNGVEGFPNDTLIFTILIVGGISTVVVIVVKYSRR